MGTPDAQMGSRVNVEFTEVSSLLNIPPSHHWWTRLSRRCRTTTMCVTSKAALLTLSWSFFIGILYELSSNPSIRNYFLIRVEFISLIYILNAISLCFYPLAGYLADNVIGRYKCILWSLKFLLISVIVAIIPVTILLSLCITGSLKLDYNFNDSWSNVFTAGLIGICTVAGLFYIAMNVSFVAFNSNIIQFGMEQLHDSPTDHQSLYIYWYVWIVYLVRILIVQPWSFLLFKYITSLVLFGVLGGCSFVMIAVSLCVAHRNKKWLLINPARVNPYKLVNRITHFARHHKVPIRRSAFTYCEDEIPTGLDLAKTKYGGPFTTEEVENVKALYGILKILFSLGPVFFFTYASDPAFFWYSGNNFPNGFYYITYQSFNYTYDDDGYNNEFSYQYFFGSNLLSSLTTAILIPTFIIVKQFCCCCNINMLKRIGLGIIFQILTLMSIAGLISVIMFPKHGCLLQNLSKMNDIILKGNIHTLSFLPIILPHILYGIANLFLYTAMYEFICAQSPPSMKGLLIGLSFAIKGIFQAIGAVFVIPFSYIPAGIPSCGLWYYGTNIVLAIIALAIFTCVARKYTYRQRDEICNVYRYAEEYYSNKQEE